MHDRASYAKLSAHSRWFEHFGNAATFLVGIELRDRARVPREVNRGTLRDVDGERVAGNPNYVVGEVTAVNLRNLDADPNVDTWGIVRKTGPVELTDGQIWAAYLQAQSEFPTQLLPVRETREEFQANDPIGYDELMAAMERVVYRALGYL